MAGDQPNPFASAEFAGVGSVVVDLNHAVLAFALDGDLKHPLEVAVVLRVESIGQRRANTGVAAAERLAVDARCVRESEPLLADRMAQADRSLPARQRHLAGWPAHDHRQRRTAGAVRSQHENVLPDAAGQPL